MKIVEYIIDLLNICGRDGISFRSICKKLSITGYSEKEDLLAVLNNLEREKIIIEYAGKYFLYKNAGLVEGKIKRHERGFAFLIRSDGEKDLFIPPKYLNGAYQGDKVLVKMLAFKDGESDEAEVVKVVERGVNRLTGVYFAEKGYGFVTPDDSGFGSDIYIAKGRALNAKTGQKVAVKILSYPKNGSPNGIITDILGNPFDINTQVQSVLINNEVALEFPEGVLREAERIDEEISSQERISRHDFTNLLTVTIDGDDAKDFDDAISLEKIDSGYILFVHIADVSAFVKEGGKIDKEAYKRGTSIYIPGRVFPMLPERLSNGLCSLNPNVERLTLTAKLTFDKDANLIEKSFYKSIIRSNYRLTYKKVQAIFDGDSALREEYSEVLYMLECARELMHKMLALRDKKGSVDLGVEECRIFFENGELVVEKREGIESERLIEQFMIAANVAVAEFIYYSELPLIYRVHGKPDGDKLLTLKSFLKACGLKAPQKLEFPMDFQKILVSLNGLPIKGVVSDVMLRSMQKAVYSAQNQGHFGLNERCYCHFTSPIRRYPDLIVHRILKAVLEGRVGEILERYENTIDEIALNTSDCERRADLIERDIDDLYICKFMESFVGDFFEGIVSGVTSFGVFVRLENAVEGLIPLENLPKGRYEFYEESFTLKSNKLSFKLGEALVVKLVATDSSSGRIYFELIRKL